ncbi:MAG: hypothetical protein Q4G52_08680 [Clostridia bacterium]|nr:hypothetical protein [Clostridia bacterium]
MRKPPFLVTVQPISKKTSNFQKKPKGKRECVANKGKRRKRGDFMDGNYERGMYRQLQELMKDLDNLRSEFRVEREEYEHQIKELREEIASERKGYEQRILELESELCEVKAENELLKRDNERMKRELNNNSGNSSLPPSSDLHGKAPNTYNARAKSSRAKGRTDRPQGEEPHQSRC